MTEQTNENSDPHPVVIEKSPETLIPIPMANRDQLPAKQYGRNQ